MPLFIVLHYIYILKSRFREGFPDLGRGLELHKPPGHIWCTTFVEHLMLRAVLCSGLKVWAYIFLVRRCRPAQILLGQRYECQAVIVSIQQDKITTAR